MDKFGLLSGRICTAIPMTIGKIVWNIRDQYNDYQAFRPYNDDILFESTISWIWNLFNCYISHWDPDYKPTLTGESVISEEFEEPFEIISPSWANVSQHVRARRLGTRPSFKLKLSTTIVAHLAKTNINNWFNIFRHIWWFCSHIYDSKSVLSSLPLATGTFKYNSCLSQFNIVASNNISYANENSAKRVTTKLWLSKRNINSIMQKKGNYWWDGSSWAPGMFKKYLRSNNWTPIRR